MPQLGESVTEGTITNWLKQPGDEIAQYEPLCEVTTDKVTAEVPATCSGILTEIVAPEGETVAVGEAICSIETQSLVPVGQSETTPEQSETFPLKASGKDMRMYYSPAVRRLAREHHIDLRTVTGTGRGGRVTKKDVVKHIERIKESEAVVQKIPDREVSLTSIRRTIAERMVKSVQEVPHAWTMIEADVTPLVRLREKLKDSFYAREGIRLTYLPFFIKSVVEALKQFPRLNAVFAGDKIIEKKEINISVAVAADDALFVPVIHRADQLNVLGIARELEVIVQKTKKNKLTLEDTVGGTFTVNNTGAFGSVVSKPIINMPQAGIVTLEKIVKRPVVIDEAIAIRDMVNVCLSFDHRVIDGWTAGQFLQCLKQTLETFREEDVL